MDGCANTNPNGKTSLYAIANEYMCVLNCVFIVYLFVVWAFVSHDTLGCTDGEIVDVQATAAYSVQVLHCGDDRESVFF